MTSILSRRVWSSWVER